MKPNKPKAIKVKNKVKNIFPYGDVLVPDVEATKKLLVTTRDVEKVKSLPDRFERLSQIQKMKMAEEAGISKAKKLLDEHEKEIKEHIKNCKHIKCDERNDFHQGSLATIQLLRKRLEKK